MTSGAARSQPHRLVLTGATGTLGHSLLLQVSHRSDTEILALVRPHSKVEAQFDRVHWQQTDFFDRDAVARVIRDFQPTSVIHCAASGMRFPKPEWFDLIRFNVDVSLHLCESVSKIPGCQFVFVSTGLGYRDQGRLLREDDPLDTAHPYGASKAAADMLVRAAAAEFDVPLVVLRPFSFSGPGDTSRRLFPALLRAAAAGKPFEMSPGDQVRDHCAAHDIAAGIVQAMMCREQLGAGTHVFNLGSGSSTPLRFLVENVLEQLGLEVDLLFGARDYARFEPKFLAAEIARAEKMLHWRPKMNFAYAIWELARQLCPDLPVRQPRAAL